MSPFLRTFTLRFFMKTQCLRGLNVVFIPTKCIIYHIITWRMKLNLTKPIIIFDLETTGLDTVHDRIIQISYIKVMPDGTEKRCNMYINPECKIPQEVVNLTGISDEMVANEPTFSQVAADLKAEFEGCDFAGYNSNHFDIPLLAEEFSRANVEFDFYKCRRIDVQTIFHKMEQRNLAAAYKFYCGRKMEEDFEAHKADNDTEATYRVLQGQLDMYSPERQTDKERQLINDMDALAAMSTNNHNVDFAGRMVWKQKLDHNGKPEVDNTGKAIMQEVFNFGKYKGEAVADVIRKDPGYYSWMMGGDFPATTKQILARIRIKEMAKAMEQNK